MRRYAAVLDGEGAALSDDPSGARMVALMRCLLALSALVIFYVDPAQPARLDVLIYASLAAYLAYSIALATAVVNKFPLVPWRLQHWIDVLVYVYLVAISGASAAVFFYFFYFAVLVASFSRGFGEGIAVTLVSVVSFTLVELLSGAPRLQLDRTLARPVYLLLLGYMVARWGGHELALRRRLRLLKELGTVANPRLGVDHALTQHLRRLAAFFEADDYVLVCPRPGPADYVMYRSDALGGHRAQPLTEQAARALLTLPADASLAWDPAKRRGKDPASVRCAGLANLLETCCFVTAPYGERRPGRLYLLSRRRGFSEADAAFLRQAAVQIASSVDNLALLEELMTNAAQLERSRISRDIHDTTIQPYIGLKLGLEALHRKLEPGSTAAVQVEELLEMSTLALNDLRGYVARLRGTEPGWAADQLVAALRQQAARYRSFFGIDVEIRGDPTVQLTDRVAGDAYQIACEALSNVYRHTEAKRAFVDLHCEGEALVLTIGNERAAHAPTKAFMPRSIAERAAALGGTVEVQLDRDRHDAVRVTIPL